MERRNDRDRNGRESERNGPPPEAQGPAEPAAAAVAPEPRERKPLAAGPAGGVYIPPFKLAQMMAEASDKESAQVGTERVRQ